MGRWYGIFLPIVLIDCDAEGKFSLLLCFHFTENIHIFQFRFVQKAPESVVLHDAAEIRKNYI